MKPAPPKRGEIRWVKLDPATGSEIRKTRPAVVVSNDSLNRFAQRVVVVPLTSNVDKLFPGEVLVKVKGKPARALCDQMRSIDNSRLGAKVAALSAAELSALSDALRITLALV